MKLPCSLVLLMSGVVRISIRFAVSWSLVLHHLHESAVSVGSMGAVAPVVPMGVPSVSSELRRQVVASVLVVRLVCAWGIGRRERSLRG